ncbi:MAG: hypothetical protein KDA20_10975 [Phycisphaerales bacterium]|nr:hypothetical protein [Phycisphaerales bacterium]
MKLRLALISVVLVLLVGVVVWFTWPRPTHVLVAVSWQGDILRVEPGGASAPSMKSASGLIGLNCLAAAPGGRKAYSIRKAADASWLIEIDPKSLKVSTQLKLSQPLEVRGLAAARDGTLYAVATDESLSNSQALFKINAKTGACDRIGSLGIDGVQGLAFAPDGRLFGYGIGYGQPGTRDATIGVGLVEINPKSASVRDISERPAFVMQTIAFRPDGQLIGLTHNQDTGGFPRAALVAIDSDTESMTLIGDTAGYFDLRGLDYVVAR